MVAARKGREHVDGLYNGYDRYTGGSDTNIINSNSKNNVIIVFLFIQITKDCFITPAGDITTALKIIFTVYNNLMVIYDFVFRMIRHLPMKGILRQQGKCPCFEVFPIIDLNDVRVF